MVDKWVSRMRAFADVCRTSGARLPILIALLIVLLWELILATETFWSHWNGPLHGPVK